MKRHCKFATALCLSIVTLTAAVSPALHASALGRMDYVLGTDNTTKVSIPLTHKADQLIRYFGGEGGTLSQPSDLFVDDKDQIFIVDTGNNRVVKLDAQGNYIRSYSDNGRIGQPGGVYVAKNGDLYISDPIHERIVHLTDADVFIEEFVKPKSEMLDETMRFQVGRVALSQQGYLYTVRGQYFMMIDAHNEFKGYVGDNALGFSLQRLLIRTFASKEQKDKLVKEEATSYYSFDIGDDGMIYATTMETQTTGQIQKINTVGDNIYPVKAYGETYQNKETGQTNHARFVDLAVDQSGVLYVLEQYSKQIYCYDQNGNLLTVFGGEGTIKGTFVMPVAVDTNSKGDVLVLDSSTGYLHKFTKTRFMNHILDAVGLYDQGKYPQAQQAWADVIAIDSHYPVANRGIADALYKQKEYQKAMTYYRVAEDKSGYGKAFLEDRYELFRAYFGWVVLAAVVLIAAVIAIIWLLKRQANRLVSRYFSGRGHSAGNQ